MRGCQCVKAIKELCVSGSTVYRGRIITVEEDAVMLPSGRTAIREVVRTANSVSCGITDAESRICLVRQYRYPAGRFMWEIPAGRLEQGEEPEEAAIREAGEETGLNCRIISKVCGFYLAAGFASEFMHMFLMEAIGSSDAVPDEDESIEASFFDLEEALEMIESGEIEDSKTLIFLNWYARRTMPKGHGLSFE